MKQESEIVHSPDYLNGFCFGSCTGSRMTLLVIYTKKQPSFDQHFIRSYPGC